MRLEIRLLGTVELRADGRVVTPGAGRQRALLPALALAANRSVSLGQLVEMVWADVPPASAMSNLRSHAAVKTCKRSRATATLSTAPTTSTACYAAASSNAALVRAPVSPAVVGVVARWRS